MSQQFIKRIVFCFDGTWNRLSVECPTNVVKIAQMIEPLARDGTPQIVYYDEGIGTDSKFNRYSGGVFGEGIDKILREAYRFLIFNYAPGDEIFAFGFSRGAFTARSFIGLIRHAGILDVASAKKIDEAIEVYRTAPAGTGIESERGLAFRKNFCSGVCVSEADRDYRIAQKVSGADGLAILEIPYVGVWDTVKALGVPDFIPGSAWINRRTGFHDAILTSKIKSARHAVALDEQRPTFRPTLFQNIAELNTKAGFVSADDWQAPYQQRWFAGVHGAVGGGGSRHGLSDGALEWVLTGARKAGLKVRTNPAGEVYGLSPDPFDHLNNEATVGFFGKGIFAWLRGLVHSPRLGPTQLDELHRSVLQRWFAPADRLAGGQPYRPGALKNATAAISSWTYAPDLEAKAAARQHTVARGETLGTISARYFGDKRHWRDIFNANRDRLDDPDSVTIGQVLNIPEPPPPPPPAQPALDS